MNAKKVVSTCLTALLAFATPVGADATECGKLALVKYNSKVVRTTADSVSFVSSQLAVDADGAPNSYRVDGNGLSYTCDGVTAVGSTPDSDPKHWQQKCRDGWKLALQTGDYTKLRIFGFLTGAKNVPVKQDAGDPSRMKPISRRRVFRLLMALPEHSATGSMPTRFRTSCCRQNS